VTAPGDVDFYRYTLPGYSGTTVTARVQTSGISLLAPRLTAYDASGQAVGSSASTDPLGGGVTVTLTNATPGGSYFFKVEGGRGDVFGVGSYRLKIGGDPVSSALIQALDAVYDGTAFRTPQLDRHTNDVLSAATDLTSPPRTLDGRFDYALVA